MPTRRPTNPTQFVARSGREARQMERFCHRCGSRENLRKHHWAPRAVFLEEADDWPVSYLCKACHEAWHNKMGWRPRVKTMHAKAARMQHLREQTLEEIENSISENIFLETRHADLCTLRLLLAITGDIPVEMQYDLRGVSINYEAMTEAIENLRDDMQGNRTFLTTIIEYLIAYAVRGGMARFRW